MCEYVFRQAKAQSHVFLFLACVVADLQVGPSWVNTPTNGAQPLVPVLFLLLRGSELQLGHLPSA
jgi:hypothetical protein